MAPIPPVQNLAFQAPATSSEFQAHTKASSSKQVVSVDVTFKVVWTAGEPPEPPSSRPSIPPFVWTTGGPRPLWSQGPTAGWAAAGSPAIWPPTPSGSIRITGSKATAEGSIWSRVQSQGQDAQCVPTPQPIPEGKIPCIAMLDRGTLGGLSICLYDIATDSFNNFSADDGTWGHEKDYQDYGDVQMSTKKWFQGSWVSVEDDKGNEFLFLTVEKDHGAVRVWRPNLVAKRVFGVGETELSHEEVMRLGLDENDEF